MKTRYTLLEKVFNSSLIDGLFLVLLLNLLSLMAISVKVHHVTHYFRTIYENLPPLLYGNHFTEVLEFSEILGQMRALDFACIGTSDHLSKKPLRYLQFMKVLSRFANQAHSIDFGPRLKVRRQIERLAPNTQWGFRGFFLKSSWDRFEKPTTTSIPNRLESLWVPAVVRSTQILRNE